MKGGIEEGDECTVLDLAAKIRTDEPSDLSSEQEIENTI
jgi:hypothetical protein